MDWRSSVQLGVLVQGLTGRAARRHVSNMAASGTWIVGGVVPGRRGVRVDGVEIFDTVGAAKAATGATASVAFLTPDRAGEGLLEAVDAGLDLVVCVTEGVSPHDTAPAIALAKSTGATIVGPNSPGVLVPGEFSLGFLPWRFALPGSCAVVSRSGTLSYEVVLELSRAGVGQSFWAVVGGDSLKGVSFTDLILMAAADRRTEAIALVGEIGGSDEEDAAPLLAEVGLPAVAIIAGRHAPPNRVLGHAGAFIDGTAGTYRSKADALRAAGVPVVSRPSDVPGALLALGAARRGGDSPPISAP